MFEPGAPQAVTLTSVGAHTAVVTWTAPTVTGTAVSAYYVQLRRGNENAAWVTVVSRGGQVGQEADHFEFRDSKAPATAVPQA